MRRQFRKMPNLQLADENVNSIISYIETFTTAKLKEKAGGLRSG